MHPHMVLDVCYTLTARDGIAYLDKIIPILPLLSIASAQTTWIPHISTFFQNKILRWSIRVEGCQEIERLGLYVDGENRLSR